VTTGKYVVVAKCKRRVPHTRLGYCEKKRRQLKKGGKEDSDWGRDFHREYRKNEGGKAAICRRNQGVVKEGTHTKCRAKERGEKKEYKRDTKGQKGLNKEGPYAIKRDKGVTAE